MRYLKHFKATRVLSLLLPSNRPFPFLLYFNLFFFSSKFHHEKMIFTSNCISYYQSSIISLHLEWNLKILKTSLLVPTWIVAVTVANIKEPIKMSPKMKYTAKKNPRDPSFSLLRTKEQIERYKILILGLCERFGIWRWNKRVAW